MTPEIVSAALAVYTIIFTMYIFGRIIQRAHYHFPAGVNATGRAAFIILLFFLAAACTQVAVGQTQVWVTTWHDASYSSALERRSAAYALRAERRHQAGAQATTQSLTLLRMQGNPHLSARASWTQNKTAWQQASVSIHPLLRQGSEKYAFDLRHLLSVSVGDTDAARFDHWAQGRYVSDQNMSLSYSPLLYHRWRSSAGFVDVGARAYGNAHLRRSDSYWAPKLALNAGPGLRVGTRWDADLRMKMGGFVGPALQKTWSEGWTSSVSIYLTFRGAYRLTDTLTAETDLRWSSSSALGGPGTFAEISGRFGLSYSL